MFTERDSYPIGCTFILVSWVQYRTGTPGLEPGTIRLTAGHSTIELHAKVLALPRNPFSFTSIPLTDSYGYATTPTLHRSSSWLPLGQARIVAAPTQPILELLGECGKDHMLLRSLRPTPTRGKARPHLGAAIRCLEKPLCEC